MIDNTEERLQIHKFKWRINNKVVIFINKEEAIEGFKKRIEEGKSIKYAVFRKEDPKLLGAIEKKIGSIFKCAKLIGLTEDDLVNKYGMTRQVNGRTLDEEEIKHRLYYLKSIGKLTTLAMRTEFDDLRLERSIKKLYGSVEEGLKHFNLERDSKLVSYDSLVEKVKDLYNSGEDISYKNMITNHSKIIHTLCNKLNISWYKVLEHIGIDFQPLKLLQYDDELIKQKLHNLMIEHNTISYPILKKYESGLLNYIHRNYDSMYDFYIKFGYNPIEHMDSDTQKFKGYLFEIAFRELLDEIGVKYEYNKPIENNTLRPDFRLSDTVLLDCKLSSWTSTIESTIEKYSPHCEKLIIVFLRGEEKHLTHLNNNKVICRKVDYYLEKLDKMKRQHFIDRFNYILNNEFVESVTTARLTS